MLSKCDYPLRPCALAPQLVDAAIASEKLQHNLATLTADNEALRAEVGILNGSVDQFELLLTAAQAREKHLKEVLETYGWRDE